MNIKPVEGYISVDKDGKVIDNNSVFLSRNIDVIYFDKYKQVGDIFFVKETDIYAFSESIYEMYNISLDKNEEELL